MEDQIKLFAARSRRKLVHFCQMYLIFILFGIAMIYLLSNGNVEKYKDYYIALGSMAGIFAVLLIMIHLLARRGLRKQLKKFSSEEISRINREAAKGPQLEHVLITQDVIAYAMGIRTVLIPVRDIIWIKRRHVVRANVVHAKGMFFPMASSERYIDIRTRDNKVHHISNDVKDELEAEIYNYLVFTVKMKRPCVLLEREEDWNRIKKDEFQEIVERVDAVGEEDPGEIEMLYNLEHLYELCRSGIGDSRQSEVKLMAAVVASYFVAFFLFQKPELFLHTSNPLKLDLFSRIFQTFVVGFVMFLPIVFVVVCFLKTVILDKERTFTQVIMAVYFVFAMMSVGGFAGFVLMTDERVHGIEAVGDWRAYASGELETYEGTLVSTTSPVVNQIRILTDKKYQYFQGEQTAFRYYPGYCIEPNLMQQTYRITYTPRLRIIASLTDANGNERLALSKADVKKQQEAYDKYLQKEKKKYADSGIWEIGDIIFPKNLQVQGYDSLTEEQQKDFDLLYSDILQEGVEATRVFYLPAPLEKKEFNEINALYDCNHKYDAFQQYTYKTDDRDIVEKAYVSRTVYSEKAYNSYSPKYQKRAKKIASRMPKGLSLKKKVAWISDYLLKHVKLFDYFDWLDKTNDGENKSSPEYKKGILSDTGYGALFYGVATKQGYMEAFGMIAQKAGIYSIAAMDSDEGKYWNLVRTDEKWRTNSDGESVMIDEEWRAVNVHAMAQERNRDKYLLITNDSMEKYMEAKATYGMSEWFACPD